jgi:catechol 2,3-dioxygenase-like lactoylglutathione lyase family enzyme
MEDKAELKVIEIAFVGYNVTDLKRARRFYEGTLGLKQTLVFGDEDVAAWIEYDIGPGTLAIGNFTSDRKPSHHGGYAGLEVEDFEAAIERLKKDGVPFIEAPEHSAGHHMAVISDPDGNAIVIHKRNK